MGTISELRQDLVAAARSQLSNVDRLTEELEAHITDFRKLLDRNKKNERSRTALQNGLTSGHNHVRESAIIEIDGLEYEVSDEFKNSALVVADNLNLDELEAAKLCIAVQDDTSESDQTLAFRAILKFHDNRHNLLDCIRLVLKQSLDDDASDKEDVAEYFRSIAAQFVDVDASPGTYLKSCIQGLSEVEEQIKQTQDHVQAALMTGQPLNGEYGELLHSQRMLLTRQHEELVAIICHLIRAQHTSIDAFRTFLSKAAATEATTAIISHFMPVFIAGSTYYGSDPTVADATASELHRMFAAGPQQLQWKNGALKAAATVCWLVEYNSRFADSSSQRVKPDSSDETRQQLFFESLKENAFQFMLATADFMQPEVWHDPAKMGLVKFLLDNTTQFSSDAIAVDAEFAQLTMQEFQGFADALVSHMPDVLRQLKDEEDEKRRNLAVSANNTANGYDMHLERFLLIVAYAYQNDAAAAMDFWADTESNMYGFLRWASKRLPTPRVAAFCELLRSLASDEKSATHAHLFLLEDVSTSVQRSRKTYGVGWTQIFSELELYANSIRNRPAIQQSSTEAVAGLNDPDIIEAETPIMLEAYLRLTAHIISTSTQAQNWILREQSFHLHEITLQLAQSSSPPAVQACCFNVLAALLTGKPSDVSDGLWVALDTWLAGGGSSAAQRAAGIQRAPPEKQYMQQIGADVEVATAFIHLLNALISPADVSDNRVDDLPFPEQLGSTHRHAGIESYVDFVLGQAFALLSSDPAAVEDRMQLSVLRHACLTFAHICLSTFNEDLAILANVSAPGADAIAKVRPFETYARLHPFARTMEYLFNDGVVGVLLQTAQQHIDELDTLENDSPLVQATIKAVEVMRLAMQMQATYFDIVRPLIKIQSAPRSSTVANPALSSFDEVLVLHLDLAVSLARYAICRHTDLVLPSIDLLRLMSQSCKIVGQLDGPVAGRSTDRLVSRLAEWNQALQAELKANFCLNVRVLEFDENPITFVRAVAVLDLLNTSLAHSPERPTLAHCLLGFECQESSIDIVPGSFFAEGRSLFHVITTTIATLPTSFGPNHLCWLQSVRTGCVKLLSKLANADLTSGIVSAELRSMDFYPAVQETFTAVSKGSIWDDFLALDANVLFQTGAADIRDFIRERESMVDLVTKELHAVSAHGMDSSRDRHVGILLGTGGLHDRGALSASLAFELLDFYDLDVATPMEADVKLLQDVDTSQYIADGAESCSVFDTKRVRQVLLLKKRQLWLSGKITDINEEQQFNDEMLALLTTLEARNRYAEIHNARLDALESWTDMLITLLSLPPFTSYDKAKVAREALHIILPRLERAFQQDLDAAAQLAKLALAMVRTIAEAVAADGISFADNSLERLAKLFLLCLRATTNVETGLALRDVCYRVCSMIIKISSGQNRTSGPQQLLDTFQDISERVARTISEDAFSGRGVTRVSALLFLDSMLRLATSAHRSTIVLRALVKINFVPVLIDSSIGSVSETFENAGSDLSSSLAFFYTATALLLDIAQADDGPQLILNSNFISAVEDSRLFSTDPDIGLDIDNDAALEEFYQLLTAIVKILVAIVVKRGVGDGAVVQLARRFLSENRSSVAAIFKLTNRYAYSTNRKDSSARQVAAELTTLMLVTGFIEEDEAQGEKTESRTAFS